MMDVEIEAAAEIYTEIILKLEETGKSPYRGDLIIRLLDNFFEVQEGTLEPYLFLFKVGINLFSLKDSEETKNDLEFQKRIERIRNQYCAKCSQPHGRPVAH